MKIRVQKIALEKAVKKLLNVVPGRPRIPILSNILLSVTETGLALAATDLELFITAKIDAEIHEAGAVTVSAKPLAELLKGLPDLPVTLTAKGEQYPEISLDANGGHYTLAGFPAGDFPGLPAQEEDVISFQVDGKELVEMIKKTSYAVSTDRTRAVLTGVLFKAQGDLLTLVATDGQRVPIVSRDISPASKDFETIVPPQALCCLTRLIAGKAILQRVFVGERIEFDFGETQLSCRLIEGDYPQYKNLIPKNKRKMVADRVQLLSAIERVSILTDPERIPVCFSLSKGLLAVSTENNGAGGAWETISAEYEQDDFAIGFNSNLILFLLKHMDSERILFELDSSATCALVRPVTQPEGEDYLSLIMPMRLK